MAKQLKEIEIPFGAKDSELIGWEYTIPEGMEAEIKDGKIFVKEKESDDERIRKRIIHALHGDVLEMSEIKEAIAWLEKQGEQKPADKVSLEFKKGDILYEQKTMSILLVYERNGSWLMTFCDYWMLKEKLHVEFPYENYGFVQEMSLVPATKEQRDQLERAMTNAGYKWNKEELKLEKI